MKARRFLLVLAGVLILGACSGEPEVTVLQGSSVTLNMFDNRFEYAEVRIPIGGSVNFLGAGRNAHNAVASDESWSTEETFGTLEQLEDDSAVITFDEAGTYQFFCTFHGNAEGSGMAATLIVGDDV